MSLMDFFRSSRKGSASVAKERLQILVAHDRAQRNSPSYLPKLQREILEVIRKYVAVDQDAVSAMRPFPRLESGQKSGAILDNYFFSEALSCFLYAAPM